MMLILWLRSYLLPSFRVSCVSRATSPNTQQQILTLNLPRITLTNQKLISPKKLFTHIITNHKHLQNTKRLQKQKQPPPKHDTHKYQTHIQEPHQFDDPSHTKTNTDTTCHEQRPHLTHPCCLNTNKLNSDF